MGGFGSGDWADFVTRKDNTSLCRTISAKQLKDLGLLSGSDGCEISWRNCFGESLGTVHIELLEGGNGNRTRFLILRHGVLLPGDDEKAAEYRVELTQTPCFYGGFRYWFICPLTKDGVYCGNRVGKLYLPRGGRFFGCRHCYDLTYESCQTSHKHDRIFDHIPDGLDLSGLRINQVLRLAGL